MFSSGHPTLKARTRRAVWVALPGDGNHSYSSTSPACPIPFLPFRLSLFSHTHTLNHTPLTHIHTNTTLFHNGSSQVLCCFQGRLLDVDSLLIDLVTHLVSLITMTGPCLFLGHCLQGPCCLQGSRQGRQDCCPQG